MYKINWSSRKEIVFGLGMEQNLDLLRFPRFLYRVSKKKTDSFHIQISRIIAQIYEAYEISEPLKCLCNEISPRRFVTSV